MKELNMNELEMVAGGELIGSIINTVNNTTAGAVGAVSSDLNVLEGRALKLAEGSDYDLLAIADSI